MANYFPDIEHQRAWLYRLEVEGYEDSILSTCTKEATLSYDSHKNVEVLDVKLFLDTENIIEDIIRKWTARDGRLQIMDPGLSVIREYKFKTLQRRDWRIQRAWDVAEKTVMEVRFVPVDVEYK